MEAMRDFLSILRTDRKREISKYKKKDYLVSDSYRMVRKIQIEGLLIGVQVSSQDYYFYLIDDSQNAYFSVRELYNLLFQMSIKEGKKYVLELLEKQIKNTEEAALRYENIDYAIKKTIIPEENDMITVEDGSSEVSYRQLFVLLNLVQQKSNTMFENSLGNESYKNGILRLLMTLIEAEKDHEILQSKGWFFDIEEDKFIYKEILNEEDKRRKKYYLTEEERDDIMSIES
ncbi:hypothetical protein [Butyrivibrio sp. M55]|uniref:hypothetical protein n=1 Tax=Butyrivibrio sp. M55 TaxID=1855323 RepID=UPI0008E43354|nr:hypothetical protein [Butyrivibrio sp. M55]SFU75153.1 hypothetical protein SAMN05216540_10865 [Butyrivibrio sp. M55]